MITAYVEYAVATQKIQVRLVIHVVEIRALRSRIDLVEPDHPLGRHQRRVHVPFVQLVIFTQPRGNNFLQVESHVQTFSDLDAKRKSVAASLCKARASLIERRLKKSCRIGSDPAALILELVFS